MSEGTATGGNRLNNDVIADLAVKAAMKPGMIKLEDAEVDIGVALLPAGMRLESVKKFMDEYRQKPERKKGTAKLGDLASLIAHVNLFKDEHSVLFARPGKLPDTAPVIEAVLNYNEPTDVIRTEDGKPEGKMVELKGEPRYGDHRAAYAFPFSEEWKAWVSQDGKQMPQDVFAAFLEDRIADVSSPDAASNELSAFFFEKLGVDFATPSRLIELSRGLSLRIGQKVRNAQNLATGEAQVQFVEEHSDDMGQPLKVPGAFLLAIPVFQFGAPYQLAARLRYRVSAGSIVWFFDLHRADRIFDHAFKEACDQARTKTELPLFIGSPE